MTEEQLVENVLMKKANKLTALTAIVSMLIGFSANAQPTSQQVDAAKKAAVTSGSADLEMAVQKAAKNNLPPTELQSTIKKDPELVALTRSLLADPEFQKMMNSTVPTTSDASSQQATAPKPTIKPRTAAPTK